MGVKLLGFKNTTQLREERIKRSHPDVEFLSGTGRQVKLVFGKEYRAHIYNDRYKEWEDMKLGSLNPETLKEYIQKNF